MIRINQVKLPIGHSQEELKEKAARLLKIDKSAIRKLEIVKRSIDARKKSENKIFYSYVLEIEVPGEAQIVKKAKNDQIILKKRESYQIPIHGKEILKTRPLIIGSGPAGLFAAYLLALEGYKPLVLERGLDVDARTEAVLRYWNGEPLDLRTNVQFGEGGAGTFSDGKLNTLVKDPGMRSRKVMETFIQYGADEEILYEQKPHIGTDVLVNVVKGMRCFIQEHGGEVRFGTCVSDLLLDGEKVCGVKTEEEEEILADQIILAIGHSARDTFRMLEKKKIPMEAKSFAVGLRIQHPQEMINFSQYGAKAPKELGAAPYKITAKTSSQRGVYSFCMCPGGYVVDASSEAGRIAVNGMSYHARDSKNANSAIIVSVTPEDYGNSGPLSGILFQEKLEEKAYACGKGHVPVQLYEDFKANRVSTHFGDVEPQIKGSFAFGNLRQVLPEELSSAFLEAMDTFERQIHGFSRPDAILAGVESRTSSPVRIHRDDTLQSQIRGLYPCGEGAGYAGGITSAAMDGLRVAEEIIRTYAPFDEI